MAYCNRTYYRLTTKEITEVQANANAMKIMQYLIDSGFTPPVAAGIVGNIYRESHCNPDAYGDVNKGGSYGICQWHLKRHENLRAYASKKGAAANDLKVQVEFLLQELNTSYKSNVLDKIRGSNSETYVADIFCRRFEVPADPNSESPKRQAYATEMLKKWQNKK